jgi:hypothetical protein
MFASAPRLGGIWFAVFPPPLSSPFFHSYHHHLEPRSIYFRLLHPLLLLITSDLYPTYNPLSSSYPLLHNRRLPLSSPHRHLVSRFILVSTNAHTHQPACLVLTPLLAAPALLLLSQTSPVPSSTKDTSKSYVSFLALRNCMYSNSSSQVELLTTEADNSSQVYYAFDTTCPTPTSACATPRLGPCRPRTSSASSTYTNPSSPSAGSPP